MKKIILLAISFLTADLSPMLGPVAFIQAKKNVVCSVCNRCFKSDYVLQGSLKKDSKRGALVCQSCLKKLRGKNGKSGAVEKLSITSLCVSDFNEGGDARADLGTLAPLKAGRRKQMILLRSLRTGSERKDKTLLKKLMEEEAEIAREYTWNYRVRDGHTIEVENGIKKITCVSKHPLTALWCRGQCAVLASDVGYEVHDFYSDETKNFFPFEQDKLRRYVELRGHGPHFKVYNFCPLAEKKEKAKKERIVFLDELDSSQALVRENEESSFYYALNKETSSLLVGNQEGYILTWPVEGSIVDLFSRGTEALIGTAVEGEVRHVWHDFARHNEDQRVFGQEYPITVLELPVQSKEELIRQGFSESLVSEKTFDQMFHEMAIIPEGFTQTFYSPSSLQELVGHLSFEDTRSLSQENRKYRCLLDAKKTKIEVSVGEGSTDDDGFEITIPNSEDRLWKRGSELLLPDNGCLVMYNFQTELVERFEVPKVSVLEDIERELLGLKFSEIK
jgi:hypothetical protein